MIIRSLAAASLLVVMVGCDNNRDNDFDGTTTTTTTDRTIRTNDTDLVGPSRTTRDRVGQDGYNTGAADRNWNEHRTDQGAVISPDTSGNRSGSTGANLSEVDRTFIQEAVSGGMFEVQSAQLALERNPDPQTRQIAQMLIEDHQRANQELMNMLQRRSIDFSRSMTPQWQNRLNQLRNLQGQEFTQQFQTMQRDAHEEAIALFQRQAREGRDSELKAFAQRTLPVLQKHLDHVQGQVSGQHQPGASMPEHD